MPLPTINAVNDGPAQSRYVATHCLYRWEQEAELA